MPLYLEELTRDLAFIYLYELIGLPMVASEIEPGEGTLSTCTDACASVRTCMVKAASIRISSISMSGTHV